MGTIYNRGAPERPNIWIQWYADGKRKRESIGRAPSGLTKAEAKGVERDLRRKAARRLVELEHGIAGPDEQRSDKDDPLFRDAAAAWLKQREAAGYRAIVNTRSHVNRHLNPLLADLRISDVTTGKVREVVDDRRSVGQSGASIRLILMTLSRMFNDLIERDRPWLQNPVRALDRATRRSLRSKHDPKRTPFLRTKADVAAVYHALAEHIRPAFAAGAFGGLRTNEVLALRWSDVDLRRRVILVQRQKVNGKRETGPLKDSEARVVPINDTLLGVLKAWKLKGQGELCFPAPRTGGMMFDDTPHDALQRALKDLPNVLARAVDGAQKGEGLTWYRATRHTFASHWVMDGGTLEKLRDVLGHCSVTVTERYAHLRPDVFGAADYAKACVDLSQGKVIELDSHSIATGGRKGRTAAR